MNGCLHYLALKQILAWRNNTTGVYDPTLQSFRSFAPCKSVVDTDGVELQRDQTMTLPLA